MRLTFRAKLLGSHVGLVAAVLLIVIFELNRSLGADLRRQLDLRLEQQALGVAQWVGEGRHPDRLAPRLAAVVGAQVSILDNAGTVLGDSDADEDDVPNQPNQGALPEVRAARDGQVGHATRVSPRSGEEMNYVAVWAPDGMVVRLGVPLSGIDETLRAMRRRLLFASWLAVAAALALGLVASRVAARPLRAMTVTATRIAQGDYDVDVPQASPDEFGVLSRTLGSLAAELKRDMTQIRRLEIMRRDFVANVSHEVRTPVTAIQGYAETLLRGNVDAAKSAQFLEIIHRHARRIGRLIEDLLWLSELEARPPEDAVREPVPIAALAGHVVETVQARREAARMSASLEIGEGAIALGDPTGLEQVIENLVDNALKYGKPEGRVRITGERVGERIQIRIIDDGPGIAEKHLPRIFERFYRVDPGRSRERGGTGLGLSIVKHLVESMGGTIAVESEVGKGCSFVIDLPAAPRPL